MPKTVKSETVTIEKDDDTKVKTVKKFGTKSAHIVLPYKWIGKAVKIELLPDSETQ